MFYCWMPSLVQSCLELKNLGVFTQASSYRRNKLMSLLPKHHLLPGEIE